jgi:hypothetical protein
MNLTPAIYTALSSDATLVALLASYKSEPAIFTIDPAPGDATLPYIVTAGDVVSVPFDTKNCTGETVTRDIRCYADADGSVATIEEIARRVYDILHRQPLTIDGYEWIMSDCAGPNVADERFYYGRFVTVTVTGQRT